MWSLREPMLMRTPGARVIGPRAWLLREVASQSLGALCLAQRTHCARVRSQACTLRSPSCLSFPGVMWLPCDEKPEVPPPR